MKQTNLVKEKINELLDMGFTDKNKIISSVVNELNVPRPTVRKLARELRIEFMKKAMILQADPWLVLN